MAGDENFFACLDAVEEGAELVFCFKATDLLHEFLL